MNKTKKIAFGIGIILAVLVVFTASAAADNMGRFDPQHGSATTGEYVPVMVHADLEEGWDLAGSQMTLIFDPEHIDIYSVDFACDDTPPTGPDQYCWGALDVNLNYKENGYIWAFTGDPLKSVYVAVPPPAHWEWQSILGTGIEGPLTDVEMYRIWVNPQLSNTPGVSSFEFGFEQFPEGCLACQHTKWINYSACPVPTTFVNGTFTHDYAISGYATGSAANRVNITNLNKSDVIKDKPADVNPSTGFYSLALDIPSEVEVGDVLQITACQDLDEYESKCNVSTHIVENAPGYESNINLTLNHYCLDLKEFPMYEAEAVGDPADPNKGCGPAVSKMWLDYLHNSTTLWNDTSFGDMPAKDQAELYDWGIGNNSNETHPYFDTQGMWYTVQYLDPLYSVYGYNFGKYSSTDQNYMMKQICRWISYAPGDQPGHPVHVPGAVPVFGNYENWMAVRGIHTSEDAYPLPPDLEVYGLWVNDPYPASLGGIGENSYKTAEEWKTTYYLPLDVPGEQTYNGTYVGILEPPGDDDGEITIVPSKARFTNTVTPMLAEEPMMVYGIEQLALEKVVKDDEMLKIVKAAIDGVNEELVLYDSEFAAVFAKTVPGQPMLVSSDNGDYYVVPFNVPVEGKTIKKVPVAIERSKVSGLKKLERVKRLAANTVIEQIEIEPIKVERTLVVVIVDAEDGSFKEASWVADPVKYLPVSKIEAMKLALGEVLDELNIVAQKDARDLEVIQQRPTIELVYRDASPYYPDWQVSVNGKVFYVGQDGTVS